MKEDFPKAPLIPREDPKTAPPPDYAGRRYVSVEMQRVADSDAPPDLETELSALRAEVKASHEKLATLEKDQARLSQSDGKQNESLIEHSRDISAAISAANEAKAAALALAPSNDLGAKAAQQAANGLAGLDAKTLATLIITVLGFLLAGAKALKSDPPPPAPTPVVVTLQTSAPAPPLPMVRQ